MLYGLINILGGLALFLFGVETSRQSFQKLDGWLYRTLFKLTKGYVKPFLFGTFLTLLSQNSTVATSLAIGFVDIGTMNLTEAILAMSGASFGGGLVVLLITMNIVRLAPFFLFSSFLLTRSSNSETRSYGNVLKGISLILLGMLFIQSGVGPIVENPQIKSFILWSSKNLFLVGCVSFLLTSIIQNNTAMVAIAISIAEAGLISQAAGMAIVLGAHVGSTTLILISGLNGKTNARRLGLATVIYKLLGAMLVLPFTPWILHSLHDSGMSISLSLVSFQIILASLNAVFVTPLTSMLQKICITVFPSLGNPGEPAYLNKDLLSVPMIALTLISKELARLANFVEAYLQIMFNIPAESQRLPKLRKDLKELGKECHSFFTALPLPQSEPQLRRRYLNLSMALSSTEDIVAVINQDLKNVWTSDFLRNKTLRSLMTNVLDILYLAFAFFVLEDEGIKTRAREKISEFWISENRLRYAMAYEESGEEQSGAICDLLAVFVKIIHSSDRILENINLNNLPETSAQSME